MWEYQCFFLLKPSQVRANRRFRDTRPYLYALLGVFLHSISAPTAIAQLTTAEEKGVPPNSVFQGGNVDIVNLQNGNLHISIPILSSAQRGGGILQWQFVYDTQAWMKLWVPNNCGSPHCQPAGNYVVQQNPNIKSGWRLTTPFDWSAGFIESPVITCPTTNVQYQQETNWVITDPQGTQHSLPIRLELGTTCNGQTLRGPTLDGSGLVYDSQTSTIFTKDGGQIGGVNRDTNGNYVNQNADTLDRNLLTATDGPATTYTTPLGNTTTAPQFTTYTILDSYGNSQIYRVDYQAIDFTTDICAATNGTLGSPSQFDCTDSTGIPTAVPAKLTLPSGRTYKFTYNNNTPGELARLDLPTGASASYQYGDFYQIQPGSGGQPSSFVGGRSVTSRTLSVDGQSEPWTYNISLPQTTVTDPVGNSQTHSFSNITITVSGQTKTTTSLYETGVSFSDAQNHLLRTLSKDYAAEYDPTSNGVANVRVIRTTTTLDNGQQSKKETDYETFQYDCVNSNYCPGTATRLNPTEIREFDYGSGSPGSRLKSTDYLYLHATSPNSQNYLNLNIVDRPTSVIVYDGNGVMTAQTVNEYDNYSHSGQPMQSSGAIQHDSAYGTTFTTRGNLTAVSRWRNTDGAYLTTTNQYDDAGNLLSTIDPAGHMTSYDYTDSWANNACVPSGKTAVLKTKITNALGQTNLMQYDACTGLVASVTDVNSQTTKYTYDLAGRPGTITFPLGGGQKTFCYSDDPNGSCYSATVLSSSETDLLTANTSIQRTTLYDGLGRVKQTQLNSDPEGVDFVDTTYDLDGRLYQTSNPYRSGDTEFWTTRGYDGLGRLNSLTNPDNSFTSTKYIGNTTTITDEIGNQRESQTDALGRLTKVWEDPAGANLETDYGYDVLGNLLTVNQLGNSGNGETPRQRSFSFDSLSRLLSSTNPETGTISYYYTNNGVLCTGDPSLPCSKTDARNVTTSYIYDALNRLTSKQYSGGNGITPSSCFLYDSTSATIPVSNSVGRLVQEWTQVGTCGSSPPTNDKSTQRSILGYDAMGRILTEQRCVLGNCKASAVPFSMTNEYDLAGNLTSYDNGLGTLTITNSYDTAERLLGTNSNVSDATHPSSLYYISNFWPFGAPQSSALGANISITQTYDQRLRPTGLTAVKQ